MKSNFVIFTTIILFIVACNAGFSKEMDTWNARNNKDFMNALRYMLHPVFPRYIAEPELITDASADDESDITDLHFNHEENLKERFATHFIGTRNMDIDTAYLYLKDPNKFNGLEMPHGLLLYGSPGTGKTTLARIVAGESGLDFINLSGSDFSQKYYGEGSKAVHKLFKYARDLHKPVVLFIDEIDSVGAKRTEDSNQEDRKVLNTLLAELTNEQNNQIFVVGATNHLELLDHAFQRRFNYTAKIDLPDDEQRKKIFMFYLAQHKHALHCSQCKELDCACLDNPLKRVMKKMKTNGCSGPDKPFSGSDIKEFVNRAAIYSRIPGMDTVHEQHFNIAYDKITEKHTFDWTLGSAIYRGIWRLPVIGDSLTWTHNLRKPDKE